MKWSEVTQQWTEHQCSKPERRSHWRQRNFSFYPPSLSLHCGICPKWKHIVYPGTWGLAGRRVCFVPPHQSVLVNQFEGRSKRFLSRSWSSVRLAIEGQAEPSVRLSAAPRGKLLDEDMGMISHFDLFLMVCDGCLAGHYMLGQIILFAAETPWCINGVSDKNVYLQTDLWTRYGGKHRNKLRIKRVKSRFRNIGTSWQQKEEKDDFIFR